MDRREARRGIMGDLAKIEIERDKLEGIAADSDTSGDPILAGELRRYVEKLTILVDQMYEWAGNI